MEFNTKFFSSTLKYTERRIYRKRGDNSAAVRVTLMLYRITIHSKEKCL